MEPTRWQQAREIFRVALEREPSDWPAILDRLSAGDPSLRAEAEHLLEAHRGADAFLETPMITREGEVTTPWKDPFEGRTIGSYRVSHALGQGGMGAVYLAVRADTEFHKRAALKVLLPGIDSEEIARRFRTERQILAALDHPGIARLLDGGSTEDGLPYFLMEYVEGLPIDEYCDRQRLSIRARLKLFCEVCSAVQYAHRNLVVHRDLKPSNILVTPQGTPKLLDFGIAKLLNPELSSPALTATPKSLRLMTFAYASPEQVRSEPITTASDVYSLGILLYLLLTGQRPYRVDDSSPSEILQAICEQSPQRPSQAALTADETTRTTSSSPRRSRAQLHRRLAGDLDAIVLQAIRKEPERRYDSVEQLAQDIRRHLEGYPVLARRNTLLYRSGKFLRRYPVGIAVTAAFVLTCLTFGLVMGLQRQQIAVERDRAEQVKTFLVELFEAADPLQASGGQLTLQDILASGARRLGSELAEQPATRADLRGTLGVVYQRLGAFDRAGELLEQSLKTRRQLFGPEHPSVAESLNRLADLKLATGDFATAESLLRQALANRRAIYGGEHDAVAETLNDLGKAMHGLGQLAAAEAFYRQALEMRQRFLGPRHVEVAETMNNLAVILWLQGDYAAAEPLHRQALALRQALLGLDHIEVSESLNNLAALLRDRGRYEEAKAHYERALSLRREHLGNDHPRVATSLHNLAGVLQDQGDLDAAEPLYQSALDIYRQALGRNHAYSAGPLRELARLRQRQGRLDEAEALFHEATTLLRNTVGDRHPLAGWNLALMAALFEARGAWQEAELQATEALAILESTLPSGHWKTATARGTAGACLLGQGRLEEAEPLLIESYEALRRAASQQATPAADAVRQRLVELYQAMGRPAAAARYRDPGSASA